MQSVTIRISLEAREKLRALASQTGESVQATLEKAVESYRRQCFLERTNAAFAALRRDAVAWKAEQEERAAWDVTPTGDLEVR